MCERGSHSFTCHPQVKWGVAAFTPQPQGISAHWPLLISFPVGDLNWPGNDNCTQDYMFWSVYVCTLVCCAKMAEQIMSQFGGRLRYGSKEPCIKWGGADPLLEGHLRADMYVCHPVVKYRHPVVRTVQRGDHVFVLIAQLLPLKLEHRGAHWCGQCSTGGSRFHALGFPVNSLIHGYVQTKAHDISWTFAAWSLWHCNALPVTYIGWCKWVTWSDSDL